jgi:hypothetical protein
MALIKLVKKAVKAGAGKLTKKKKADKRKYDDLPKGVKRDIKEKKEKGGQLKGPKTRGKEQMRKLIGEPKNTKAEKVVGKRSTKKDTKKRVPKKSDRRIEGSGKFSARPPGSKGKAIVKSDAPRGGTTGVKMSEARKKQMRDTANLGSEMKRLGRKYDDLPKGVKRTILMAIRSKDPAKIKKAMRGTNMTASEFVKVFNKRGKM